MARPGGRLRNLWRRLSLRRQTIELAVLHLARQFGPLAMFPISVMFLPFFLVAILPSAVAIAPAAWLGINPFDDSSWTTIPQIAAGLLFWVLLVPYGLVLFVLATPWLLIWYAIAVTLMFGRTNMADRKEVALLAAIAAADPTT